MLTCHVSYILYLFLSVIVCTIIATLHSSLLISLCCVAGGADEVSSVDTLKLFLGHWCSPLRQRSGLITALTALRETSVVGFFTHSKWSLLLLTAFAGFKEGTLYLPPIFWTELNWASILASLAKKGKINCKWQWVNIYNTCHNLTQNSKIRAPLCWEADILQMAIMYQLGLGKVVYSFVLYFSLFVD